MIIMGFVLDSSDIIIIILLLVILYEIIQCCNYIKQLFKPFGQQFGQPTKKRYGVIETS